MNLRKKIKKRLSGKGGSSTFIEMAVLIIICMMILATSVTFLNVYAKHNLVNSIAHEMARYVEIRGSVGSDAYSEFESLRQAAGFQNAGIDFSRTGKIPLEESFTVTVTVQEKFGIGGVQVIPVTVKAIATGRSEVYWK